MKKPILLIAVALLALTHRSDGQQARSIAEQLKLTRVMPRGAMVYVQANDLSTLIKTWLASPVRAQFYQSASFEVFKKSHVYLKLQARIQEFETAIGKYLVRPEKPGSFNEFATTHGYVWLYLRK